MLLKRTTCHLEVIVLILFRPTKPLILWKVLSPRPLLIISTFRLLCTLFCLYDCVPRCVLLCLLWCVCNYVYYQSTVTLVQLTLQIKATHLLTYYFSPDAWNGSGYPDTCVVGANQPHHLHCRHYCVGQQHEKMQQTDSFTLHHFDGFSLSEKHPIK